MRSLRPDHFKQQELPLARIKKIMKVSSHKILVVYRNEAAREHAYIDVHKYKSEGVCGSILGLLDKFVWSSFKE